MKLSDYLKKKKLKIHELAVITDVHPQTLWNLKRGRDVRASVLYKIFMGTDNCVSIQEMYEEFILPKQNKKRTSNRHSD